MATVAVFLFPLVTAALSACNYSFRAGAGFPDYIRTVAVLPFENETNRFELTDNLYQELQTQLPAALGLNPASQEVADAVVRGVITGYNVSTPNYRATDSGAAEVLQREVTLRIQVQIVDLEQGLILWEDRGLSASGQYLEASQTEEAAIQEAIQLLAQAVVDGAQSNW
ncbi:MAG: LPS assembly lipoprotein LptE [Longimicrobiales bacterium]|nr:LPS assembly lipoprotein LptE [Longimicrobiales bacterium]